MVTIQYQSGLKIDVKPENPLNGKFVEMFFAGNGDGVIDAKDFGNNETELLNATCDAFFPSPPGVMTQREKGFRELVGLYGRVKQFSSFILDLQNKVMSPLPFILQIDGKYWNERKKKMTENGQFTPEKISGMAYDIYWTFRALEGKYYTRPLINERKYAECETDGKKSYIGFSYDKRAVPAFLKETVQNTARMYLASASFLRKHERIEGFNPEKGPYNDPISIGFIQYWREINNNGSYDISLPPCRPFLQLFFQGCNDSNHGDYDLNPDDYNL